VSPDPTVGPVRLERDGPLAVVSFDSPPLNLFDAQLEAGLVAAIDALEAAPARAVLFRADGRAVSGGVDVSVFDAVSGPLEAEETFARLIGISRRVEALPCPVVFAAHALCLTWAFELALACDILLAAESASFGLVERVIGLTPAMGGTQRLAERAGTGRAKEFVMEGRPFGARELERWNVVNRVLPDEGFGEAARAYARSLAEGPTRAHAATREILRAFVTEGLDGADRRTPEIAGALFATEDLQGAVASFLRDGPGRASFDGR
jgi:enoyl-CoA hydratase/carnithine racemase